jgi:hypothetical protein
VVFGNSKYKEAPLKNPVNDARAIGDALVQVGFEVTEKLDATRAEMTAAIRAYTQSLAARKCVGLFYYAGHGVQLTWTNYMVPVDAVIDRLEDVPKQAVAVTGLVGGITNAANPSCVAGLVTRRYPLVDINRAYEDIETDAAGRGVIVVSCARASEAVPQRLHERIGVGFRVVALERHPDQREPVPLHEGDLHPELVP